ncbi:MAG: hypothetical protein IK131_06875 [Paludibacteraceae bacterium]|nr:hypothetical protein [Paludibacteraceae bacterium]
MEHLSIIGGRLLGKKSVAGFLLGLLGLCCPFSLSAEKLDTTFVLDIDMTIDTTPCYQIHYDKNGIVTSFRTINDDNNLGYDRINIGRVTDENGSFQKQLLYLHLDRFDRWREIEDFSDLTTILEDIQYYHEVTRYNYQFYPNGMLKRIDVQFENADRDSVYYCFSPDGYLSKIKGYIFYGTEKEGCCHPLEVEHFYNIEKLFDSYGHLTSLIEYENDDHNHYNDDYYEYTYGQNGNLISTTSTKYLDSEQYYYEQNRLVKSISYYKDGSVRDSTLYLYGEYPHVYESYLLSLEFKVNSTFQSVDSFSYDKYEYDFSDSLFYTKDFYRYYTNYTTSEGASVNESYDLKTNIMTLTVFGADYGCNPSNKHVYRIKHKKPESYLTELKIDNMIIDSFSMGKYLYDLSGFYHYDFYSKDRMDLLRSPSVFEMSLSDLRSISWSTSPEAVVETSYDGLTGVASIKVIGADFKFDSTNYHVYSFLTRKIDSVFLTELKVNRKEIKDFSPRKYEYESIGEPIGTNPPGSAINYSILDYIYDNHFIYEKIYSDSLHTCTINLQLKGDENVSSSYSILFRPYIKSMSMNEKPIPEFSADRFDYVIDEEYSPDNFKYEIDRYTSGGQCVKESFDNTTGVLTLTARYETGDTTLKTVYKIQFLPSDGVSDVLGEHITLYTVDKTICVDGAEEPVYVYDLMGVLLGTGKGDEVRIPMKMAGVYVVRIGGRAVKALVE